MIVPVDSCGSPSLPLLGLNRWPPPSRALIVHPLGESQTHGGITPGHDGMLTLERGDSPIRSEFESGRLGAGHHVTRLLPGVPRSWQSDLSDADLESILGAGAHARLAVAALSSVTMRVRSATRSSRAAFSGGGCRLGPKLLHLPLQRDVVFAELAD